jgi:hypothetical protein
MKKNKILLLISIMVIGAIQVNAQVPATQALPDTSKMTYNQISLGLDLFLYPTNDQSKQQQKVDEFECYIWAMDRTGIDPLNLPKQEVVVQTGPTGGAVKGAARGAAAGAAIGAITGDAGDGAAVGAIAGGMSGRRSGKQAQAQQNQQAQAKQAQLLLKRRQ